MQPGGRRSGGAVDLGIDGLITFLVLKLFLDVGRQGHFAELGQDLQKEPFIVELDQFVAVLLRTNNGCSQKTLAEGELRSHWRLTSGLGQTFPDVVACVLQKQNFHGPARCSLPEQASREDAGVVQHETVTGTQVVQNVVKLPVFHRAGILFQDQKTGAVPTGQRRLSDQLRGKLIVKIMCFHGIPLFVVSIG